MNKKFIEQFNQPLDSLPETVQALLRLIDWFEQNENQLRAFACGDASGQIDGYPYGFIRDAMGAAARARNQKDEATNIQSAFELIMFAVTADADNNDGKVDRQAIEQICRDRLGQTVPPGPERRMICRMTAKHPDWDTCVWCGHKSG